MAARSMDEITFEALLAKFDPSVYEKLRSAMADEKCEGLCVFENVAMDSSRFGERTAMMFGPGCSLKTIEDCGKIWLKDLPSQRQYPTAYALKPKTAEADGA